MAELAKGLPPDIKLDVNFDSSVFIRDAIHETEITLIISALVTAVVCFLFLGSLNSTINVLLSIPTSVMGTFIVLYFMGFTLNFFTLLGLSLAIGIVVDDAIMVLENIVRHFHMGKTARAGCAGRRARGFLRGARRRPPRSWHGLRARAAGHERLHRPSSCSSSA